MDKRIYHAHVEAEEGYYEVTFYNKRDIPVSSLNLTGEQTVKEKLNELKDKNDKFTSNWSF